MTTIPSDVARCSGVDRIGPDHAALAAVPDMLDVYCQMVAASTPKAMMQLANRAKQQAISAHARGGAV